MVSQELYDRSSMNTSSNVTDTRYAVTRTAIAIQSSVMLVLALSSLICNGVVAITFCKSRDLLSLTCNKFVLNMTLINVFTTVFVLPFVVATSVYDDWVFRHAWCQVSGFLLILLSCALLLTLAALSYDRYYYIVKPLRHPIHMSSTRACIMIVMIWLFSLFMALLPILGWGKYGYQRPKLSCTVLWHLYSSGGYSKFFCGISIFMPLLIIIVSYVYILRAVHNQVGRDGRLSLGSIISPSEYIQAQNHQRAIATRARHSRTKAWKTLVLHVGTNLVCWIPYSVCILIETLRRRTDIIAFEIQSLSVILAFSSVLWCPIIYAFRVKMVRREISSIFRRILRIDNRVKPVHPDECSFVIETPAAFRNRSASQVTIKGYDDLLSTDIEQSSTLPCIPEHNEKVPGFHIVRNYAESSQPGTEMTDLGTSSLPGQVD